MYAGRTNRRSVVGLAESDERVRHTARGLVTRSDMYSQRRLVFSQDGPASGSWNVSAPGVLTWTDWTHLDSVGRERLRINIEKHGMSIPKCHYCPRGQRE